MVPIPEDAHRLEIAFQSTRKRILPKLDLIGKLGRGNSEGLRCNVDILVAVCVR